MLADAQAKAAHKKADRPFSITHLSSEFLVVDLIVLYSLIWFRWPSERGERRSVRVKGLEMILIVIRHNENL